MSCKKYHIVPNNNAIETYIPTELEVKFTLEQVDDPYPNQSKTISNPFDYLIIQIHFTNIPDHIDYSGVWINFTDLEEILDTSISEFSIYESFSGTVECQLCTNGFGSTIHIYSLQPNSSEKGTISAHKKCMEQLHSQLQIFYSELQSNANLLSKII